ncbi:MAG: hypothetical protein FD123_3753 [Bacteroidetes bacterium]|nr:MAG: hypothetical protein FD123_3753 [Bacteroidota bacterium]
MKFSPIISAVLVCLVSCSGDPAKSPETQDSPAAVEQTAGAGKNPATAENSNLPVIYARTVFLNKPDAVLDSIRNFVYSPGPALTLEELYKYVGMKYKGYRAGKDISPASYIAVCNAPDSAIEKVKKEFREKFGREAVVSYPPEGATVLSYGYVFKETRYAVPFLDDSLFFKKKNVDAFSVPGSRSGNRRSDQVKVRYYSVNKSTLFDQGDFIVQLITEGNKEQVYIACIHPDATLSATYEKAWKTIQEPPVQEFKTSNSKEEVKFPMALAESSSLIAPDIRINHHFDSIFNLPLFDGEKLMYSQRDLVFQLDEKGAKLEDKNVIADSIGFNRFKLPPLVVNRPFLLIMKETDKERPYLLMWVNDPEIMIPAKKN